VGKMVWRVNGTAEPNREQRQLAVEAATTQRKWENAACAGSASAENNATNLVRWLGNGVHAYISRLWQRFQLLLIVNRTVACRQKTIRIARKCSWI